MSEVNRTVEVQCEDVWSLVCGINTYYTRGGSMLTRAIMTCLVDSLL